MFELEKEVNRWRADLVNSGQLPLSFISELEVHLRDDFEQQVHDNSSEAAFALARQNLGDSKNVIREFQKNSQLSRRDRAVFIGLYSLYIIVPFVLMGLLWFIAISNNQILSNLPKVVSAISSVSVVMYITLLGLVGCYGILVIPRLNFGYTAFANSLRKATLSTLISISTLIALAWLIAKVSSWYVNGPALGTVFNFFHLIFFVLSALSYVLLKTTELTTYNVARVNIFLGLSFWGFCVLAWSFSSQALERSLVVNGILPISFSIVFLFVLSISFLPRYRYA